MHIEKNFYFTEITKKFTNINIWTLYHYMRKESSTNMKLSFTISFHLIFETGDILMWMYFSLILVIIWFRTSSFKFKLSEMNNNYWTHWKLRNNLRFTRIEIQLFQIITASNPTIPSEALIRLAWYSILLTEKT